MTERTKILEALVQLKASSAPHSWDEQAIPAYSHPNFFVSKIFWQRLKASHSVAPSGNSVLDFGCGAGAFLPWLSASYKNVYIYDLDEKSVKAVANNKTKFGWHNVQSVSLNSGRLDLPDHSLDTIFALDVLEHVDNLEKVLIEFKRVLKPTGKLVVSSPTENFIYKFARKFGGKGFQGEFHLRAAKEVETDMAKHFKVELKTRLYPIFTFFRIVQATP
jgi:2-polyprenyl-3-methyl-5-hydroxy-6-metoxy-1,4-benzoquinol methylase